MQINKKKCFNSSTVQLKEDVDILSHPEELFQFLYGTINNVVRNSVACPVMWFQFLYGTIKSHK